MFIRGTMTLRVYLMSGIDLNFIKMTNIHFNEFKQIKKLIDHLRTKDLFNHTYNVNTYNNVVSNFKFANEKENIFG